MEQLTWLLSLFKRREYLELGCSTWLLSHQSIDDNDEQSTVVVNDESKKNHSTSEMMKFNEAIDWWEYPVDWLMEINPP